MNLTKKLPWILAHARWLLFALAIPLTVSAQPISPFLVGNNLWLASRDNAANTPSAAVMNLSGQAGIRLIRIGGNEFDRRMPSNQALLTWVNRIRATGAEPLIQISQYRTAAQAAETVQFINVTSSANVAFWSIGNEPWLQANNDQDPNPTEAQIAATIEAYFKSHSAAMKAVDPSIKIFGIDSEDFQSGLHNRLFGGANNIAGKVPNKDYYYCDGISWHRYPQANTIDPAWEGLADIRTRIQNCRALVDSVNLSQGRSGGDALIWGIGEINSKNGAAVHTWGNGQMFAGFFGLAMKHAANHVAPWSLFESDGARTSTDFSLFDGQSLVPRPSYWHSQFVARHFTGNYLEGNPSVSSNTSELLVYGAEDPSKDQVSVMILNRGFNTRPYTLHLNSGGSFASPGATAINVAARRVGTYNETLPPRSTHVIIFKKNSVTRIVYTDENFIAGTPPQSFTTYTSPLAGVLDDFNTYTNITEQGYWQTLNVGTAQISIADETVVMRASDSAFASASIGSPVSPAFNFFNRGYAIRIDDFGQTASGLTSNATHFRLGINSATNRSFGSDDSLAIRITPTNLRLGYKVNQSSVQGELRTGTSNLAGSLLDMDLPGLPTSFRLSLEPAAIVLPTEETTVTYRLQLDGPFGRITRTGTFTATAADWGAAGNSALVLESRRESNTTVAGTYAEASIGAIYHQPLLLDHFDYSQFSEQNYWTPLTVGASSTATVSGGSARLAARSTSFASAAIAGTPLPELNFFKNGFTLDLKDMELSSANLPLAESFFRVSLCSTAQRSFTTPDALTLRITPESLRVGFKLDLPSVDAETRSGTSNASSALLDAPLSGPVTALRLTLIPTGPPSSATPILYAIRLTTTLGNTYHTGTFTADISLWGTVGDSSLVLESRRASSVNSDVSSHATAAIGAVNYTPIPDDFALEAPHFSTWRLGQFSSSELLIDSISGPDATPVGDGVSNFLKYAFGLNARQFSSANFFPRLMSRGTNLISLTHEERSNATDLSYRVEASTDLLTWNLPVVEESRVATQQGWQAVTTRATLTDAPTLFYRVAIDRPSAP